MNEITILKFLERFVYDSESGYVYDMVEETWYETADELFSATIDFLDKK